jgi:ABC-type sugar transport system substrate-binding protein
MDFPEVADKRGLRRFWAAAAIAAVALTVGLAACGSDDDSSSGDDSSGEAKSVYLNAYSQEIPYFQDWQAGATARAEELGWDVTSEFGNGTPEQQVQQVENALVKQPDGIIATPIDEESLIPVLQQAAEQGVAFIGVGATVNDPSVVTSFVARDNYNLGVLSAQYVTDQLGGEGKVGIIHGIRGLTFTEDKADAFKDEFAKEDGIEVIDGPYVGGFSADLGLDAAANMLTSHPDLDAIIFDNDDLAAGGIEAVQNAGINLDDIIITGTDGGEAALDLVEAGKMDYTINLCGYREGISAVDTLNTYFEEGSVDDRVVSDVEEFTTENAKEKRAELDQREECN